jgi:hypothetical protein
VNPTPRPAQTLRHAPTTVAVRVVHSRRGARRKHRRRPKRGGERPGEGDNQQDNGAAGTRPGDTRREHQEAKEKQLDCNSGEERLGGEERSPCNKCIEESPLHSRPLRNRGALRTTSCWRIRLT